MSGLGKRDAVVFNAAEFAGWVNGSLHNMPESFRGITQSTKDLEPGVLYVALKGERFDGHDFVKAALDAGAAGALVERHSLPPGCDSDAPVIRVDDTRCALRDAARVWRGLCGAKVIGITGSAGKTTTKEMAAALFSGGGNVCSTRGNFNNDIGLPISLLAMARDCDYGIFELGTNHPGEIALLADILKPDFGVITCTGTAHIENFGSVEAIAREKGSLAGGIRPGGCLFLCMEDARFDLLRTISGVPVFTVSLRNRDADFFGEVVDTLRGRVRITERCSRCRTEMESGLPGEHNAVNLLLAFAAASMAGIAREAAAAGLNNLAVPAMRWQQIERDDGVRIINDAYNASPESVEAGLGVLKDMPCAGRKIAVLGDMLELGAFAPELHRAVGAAVAESGADLICLIGEISVSYTKEGVLSRGFPQERLFCFGDIASAGRELIGRIGRGDIVLLKASRKMNLEKLVGLL